MYRNRPPLLHTCTYKTHSNSNSPLQHSLPETRVHYCSLTSASSLTTTGFSPSVWPFCVLLPLKETCVSMCVSVCVMCVCGKGRESERRWCGSLLVPAFCAFEFMITMQLWVLSPKLLRVCVCMCTVSCWGYMCGAVCPQGLSPQWPQRRLSQRETEREKEGERVPLLSPHTHTLITILLSGN